MGKGQAPWISEMYGYVFAAAEAKLKHILTEGIVVYPDEIGAGRRAPQPKHAPGVERCGASGERSTRFGKLSS